MTDGYLNPTGRGETEPLLSALPVLVGQQVSGTRPQRSDANDSKFGPGSGSELCPDNTGEVNREADPWSRFMEV